jgi:hypothetical protein
VRAVASVLLAFACWACGSAATGTEQRPVPRGSGDDVLFVGNSLTYTNDLPGLVQGLAATAGVRLQTASVAYPGYSLADHLDRQDAVRAIAGGGWRVVVLQQGPSALLESRELLRRDTALFDQRIRAAGARTALFSVWPESTRQGAFGDVAASYAAAAADVGGIYLPVTQAWLEAWKSDPSLALYSEDGFHPSAQGSYLAALVITGVLTGISPSQMSAQVVRPGGIELSIPPAAAIVLRAAATAAITTPVP